MIPILFFILLLLPLSLQGGSSKLKTIYSSIPKNSLLEHLAFYSLYPESVEGKKALSDALSLMNSPSNSANITIKNPDLIESLKRTFNLINHYQLASLDLSNEEIELLDQLAYHLCNRKKKGYLAKTEEEILKLPPEEIDLARGLLLSQLGPDQTRAIRTYEAMLDLMALAIKAKLNKDSGPKEIIALINAFIFEELGYRFPPMSSFEKKIDTYTFLSSVLDSRKGVCLGVSILYLCLAERLGIPMEIVTPPGHIFVRYKDDNHHINIETTARGIHIEDEEYLSVGTKALQRRNLKEVIGLAHVNQASIFWESNELETALKSYRKAAAYLPDDLLLKELMGYALYATGDSKEGLKLLKKVQKEKPQYNVGLHPLVDDCIQGYATKEGIHALFMRVDDTEESLTKKKKILEKAIGESPLFKSAYFSLATNYLQEHKLADGLKQLLNYHTLFQGDPMAEYYLSILFMMRYHYKEAWQHLEIAEEIVKAANHKPKTLQDLRKELTKICPK